MELNIVLNYIAKEFPEEAANLTECIELITGVLDDVLDKIHQRINRQTSERKYDQINLLIENAKKINDLEDQIIELRNELEHDLDSEILDDKDESKPLPNYGDYVVDNKIPHSLYENFAHKRPFSFEFQNETHECKTWIEVLTCFTDIIAKKNKEVLLKFVNDSSMNGKKSKYFTTQSTELRKPYLIKGTDIFLETNMSANSIRNLMFKMLQKCGYKSSDIVIYLRADYTALHKN